MFFEFYWCVVCALFVYHFRASRVVVECYLRVLRVLLVCFLRVIRVSFSCFSRLSVELLVCFLRVVFLGRCVSGGVFLRFIFGLDF